MNHQDLYEKIAHRLGRPRLEERLARQAKDARRVSRWKHHTVPLEEPLKLQGWIHTILKWTRTLDKGMRNSRNLQVEHNTFILPQLPKAFEGYRILHISDLHFECNLELTGVLIRRINRLEYDLCVFTGDYRFATFGPYKKSMDELSRVRDVIATPAYAVLGNHDCIEMFGDFERIGLPLLLNESVVLEREGSRLYLAGIDDPHYHETADLPRAARNIPPGGVSILLSHTSEVYREAHDLGFDILLCGHTHGGQICLPGGIPVLNRARAPRAFLKGPWQYRGLQGYTSRGSGAAGVDVRFNCLPEITIHTLSR